MSKRRSVFAEADDVYLTDKFIAVRKISTFNDEKGRYRCVDRTKYVPKTSKNLAEARSIFGYLRKGR